VYKSIDFDAMTKEITGNQNVPVLTGLLTVLITIIVFGSMTLAPEG
jgi:hypothetical protein